MSRSQITDTELRAIRKLIVLAYREGAASPGVAGERSRIAEWLQQTIDEGWLPSLPAGCTAQVRAGSGA